MAYATPKTDWKATDFFNTTDFIRIRDNLQFCNEWFKSHTWPFVALTDTQLTRGQNSLPTPQLINALESNLQRLHDAIGINFATWQDSKTWYERLDALYTANPDYTDWNRWEELAKCLKATIDYVEIYLNNRISGTFTLGNSYSVQKFSRGR